MSEVRLLATDLDGTLIASMTEFAAYDEFGELLTTLKEKYSTVWVACTGRSLKSFLHFFAPMQELGLAPEYVIIKHAYIYRLTRSGYRPHYAWNFFVRYHIWSSQLYMKETLGQWHSMITGMSEGVSTVEHRRNRLCLRFSTEEAAEAAATLLTEKAKPFPHLQVYQFLQEVDVRMVPFTKGLALGDLASRLGIKAAHILAIGNGHNDISMLDGSVAKLTGCPVNAEIDVMAVVHRSKGHIATKKVLEGVVEVLRAYLEDKVVSDLPEWWAPNKHQQNPRSSKRMTGSAPKRGKHSKPKVAAGWLGVLVAYTVLLAFASFGLIPFSGHILKPFSVMMDLVQKLMSWINL
jgi:hydroxymethylpyrimidine pyrophosphatase-like HAD family hydrolase